MNKKVKTILTSIIIIIIGLVVTSYGIISKINYENNKKGYKEVTARVIDTIATSESKKDKATGMISNYYVYAPIIEYKVNKKIYRYESREYNVKEPKVGSKIKIIYQKKNPKNIKFIKKDYSIKIIIIGIVTTLIGITLMIIKLKK